MNPIPVATETWVPLSAKYVTHVMTGEDWLLLVQFFVVVGACLYFVLTDWMDRRAKRVGVRAVRDAVR